MIKYINNTSHKFLVGDRIEVMKLLANDSIDLIFTSPPYNLNKDYTNNSDNKDYIDYLNFLNDTWKECKRILKKGGRLVVNVSTVTQGKSNYKFLYSDVIQQLVNLDLIPRGEIIWDKKNAFKRTAWGSFQSPSNPYLVQQYEFLLIFSKDTKKMIGDKKDSDITKEEFIKYTNSMWSISPAKAKQIGHPAPFPIELAERVLKFYSFKNSTVLDPFAGSGTTTIAAAKLNRNSIYIDNSIDYRDIAIERFDKHTEESK